MSAPEPTDREYRSLLELRTALRRFLRWSEERAHEEGLTPAHHPLLLAIRGHDDPRGPTIGDVAGHLLLRHHSAVGLVDRAEAIGLVLRRPDPDSHRTVRLEITAHAADKLARLAARHLDELERLTPAIAALSRTSP
jgi:DNA-binding MarR family transcriptional regulator